jgi:hypothetical protein
MTRQRNDDLWRLGGRPAGVVTTIADIEWRIMRASPEEQALLRGARVRQRQGAMSATRSAPVKRGREEAVFHSQFAVTA